MSDTSSPRLRVLVTGAAGAVFTNVRQHLGSEFDFIPTDIAPACVGRSDLTPLDILDFQQVCDAVLDADMVLHLAIASRRALEHLGPNEANDQEMRVNVIGTQHVFEAARRANIKRVVYMSSITVVLGESRTPLFPTDEPGRPGSLYACTKLFGEHLGEVYATRHGLSVICLRLGLPLMPDADLGSKKMQRPIARGLVVALPDVAAGICCALRADPQIRFLVANLVSGHDSQPVDLAAAAHIGYRPAVKVTTAGLEPNGPSAPTSPATAHRLGAGIGSSRGRAKAPQSGRSPPAGFTLVELLIAVTLLILIVLAASYIFDTSVKAINIAQGNSELNINLEGCGQLLRRDIAGMEHQGFLEFGARQVPNCYACQKDITNEIKQTLRTDWMAFTACSEKEGWMDGRTIGAWTRVFWGHSVEAANDTAKCEWKTHTPPYPPTLNPLVNGFSNTATDWSLMRQERLMLGFKLQSGGGAVNVDQGIETSLGPRLYPARKFHWYAVSPGSNSGGDNVPNGCLTETIGSLSVTWDGPYGRSSNISFYDEPHYYFGLWLGTVHDFNGSWHAHTSTVDSTYAEWLAALPNCTEFKVQYAMPADLRAGANGGIRWRDPPLFDLTQNALLNSVADPNYKATVADPLHPYSVVTTVPVWICPNCARGVMVTDDNTTASLLTCPFCITFDPGPSTYATANAPYPGDGGTAYRKVWWQAQTGARLIFGPSDIWPALLKITATVYDPLMRFEGPKTMTCIFAVP